MWMGRRSTDKRYPGDNRLIGPKSPYRRTGLAPQQLGCSGRNAVLVSAYNGEPLRCSPLRCTVGNTVGSLSEAQHSLVIGSLLGDGSMRCKTHALLEINHSASQRSYVDWKYQQLEELVATPPSLRQGNGSRVAYRFVTRSHSSLTPYYELFYELKRKRVPALELSPLSLAVWFMDD